METKDMLDGKSILVVDDFQTNLLVAEGLLRQAGASVTLADNGKAALETLKAGRFDIVLLDLVMPQMDGFQVLDRIRQDVPYSPLVIAATANGVISDRDKCLTAGFDNYLAKPLDAGELYAACRSERIEGGNDTIDKRVAAS